jgi:hypothetical protein
MPSTLTWIDHDAAARERSLHLLALFQEKESRDELGLGGIRDAFADRLFPGTSTIQTRLRYMLFVPWVYQRLEDQKVHAREFATRARRLELELVRPLLDSDDQAGVFGKMAGHALKRLPSSVYWAGLGIWGIRCIDASQDQYHRSIDAVYDRRARQHGCDVGGAEPAFTWHPRLPTPPESFPHQLDFTLTQEEASFLRDRIATTHSLLAHLALYRLVFGQPRQEDLLAHLAGRMTDTEAAQAGAAWRISLAPEDTAYWDTRSNIQKWE